ncbi:MAG TPA: biotin carboxylase N-terminal domain-containing protein [Acidimicrobiales bacterium]|nr:biotin carboxylase N-terminal domain-containing protein [Acidimicrobiales bacterium]
MTETLLVANRGEVARRVIRAARSMGLRAAAVYVDADAAAPHVGDADVAVRLETSYLDAGALLAAAEAVDAGAVHPGYGYLSESAAFAEAVESAGLTWIGPPAPTIAAMGDKLAAKREAAAAGLATLPSTEDPGAASAVGFPLLVKAAAGGGGKGMRVVADPADLDEALAAASREAARAFGDGRVFLERYVARARHVEVQILGDAHGHLVHLGERECSIQRRHQKLIEEAPSPAVDAELRAAMCDAALALGRRLEYRSLGTVEFLLDDETREFFFLEVNTRLQVEHPVTEFVTGLDLVREQIAVAFGAPLSVTQDEVRLSGWAVEARLCAEDPSAGFLPATGILAAFEPASEPAVRWESGVETGSVVTTSFDPMLAKVIAHGPTRHEASARLALALERLHLGGVTTNRDFLAATLRHPAFVAGDTTTDFIERHSPARRVEPDSAELWRAAVAGALFVAGANRDAAPVLAGLPSGWRNARLPRPSLTLRHHGHATEVEYEFRRDGSVGVGASGTARVFARDNRSIDVEVDGVRATSRVTRDHDALFVQTPRTTLDFEVAARFAPPEIEAAHGGLTAPMPGLITQVRVSTGERVGAGATLVVMEAMKMEHVITAPHAGVVAEIHVVPGDQVSSGVTLLTLEGVG